MVVVLFICGTSFLFIQMPVLPTCSHYNDLTSVTFPSLSPFEALDDSENIIGLHGTPYLPMIYVIEKC